MKSFAFILMALFIPFSGSTQSIIESFLFADSLIMDDRYSEAEDQLLRLGKENPYNGDYQYYLGEIFHDRGKFEKSISHFSNAQELGVYYRSNYYMALNYTYTGDYDSAIYFLTKHLGAPMSGSRFQEDLLDSTFIPLHGMEGYKRLLPPEITDSDNTAESWIKDVKYMSEMLKRTHFAPYNTLPEEEWDLQIEQLINDIPSLNEDEILVRIFQFVANLGDGHTRVLTHLTSNLESLKLPIFTTDFSDGCYIISASEEYADLLGARVVRVNQLPYDSVYSLVCSIIPIDNIFGYKFILPYFFRVTNYLHGLGISETNEYVEIEYIKEGKPGFKKVYSTTNEDAPELIRYQDKFDVEYPRYLKNYRKNNLKWYWFEYLEDDHILYVQINGIMSQDDNPLPLFCDSVKQLAREKDISAFVLDIRNNGGGNTELNKHILSMMLSVEINSRGKSYTVLGCNTFSAAQNLTTVIENYTETIFIGEPTSSRPNFIGEIYPFKLPYSNLSISSSNIYHQHGYSADTRIWTAPDILVEYSFDDYINGRDPVLEEIIKYTSEKR